MRIARIGRIGLIAAVGLLIPGLTLVAGTGVASATTAPGHTVATAGTLTMGGTATGGGGPLDFWWVSLRGGDRIQLAITAPANNDFTFALFAPGTSDATFPQALSFSQGNTNNFASSLVDLQAPYNGRFLLAVCENAGGNCPGSYPNGGTNPMDPYTFTPTFITNVSATVAAKETKAGPLPGGAPLLPLGNFEAGGGQPIDFWRVSLHGGDRIQLAVTAPANNDFTFALFAPGTGDATFPQALSFSQGNTNNFAKSIIDLQAPYNGTFLLAVCENAGGNCPGSYPNGGTNPMDPYTFTPTFITNVSATVASRETRAGSGPDGAPLLPVGNFEAGGGQPLDFWHVSLHGGDRIQLAVTAPANNDFTFGLFTPGTSDATFPQASSFSQGDTNNFAKSIINLQAPTNGRFLLAVCENAGSNCPGAYPNGGTNPMDPYTFTVKLVAGHETSTSLKLSASVVIYGKEKALKFYVSARSLFGDHLTGKVSVSDGKKVVCSVRLVDGKGTCSPATNTAMGVGKYAVTATYTGNLLESKSRPVTLTVKK